MAASKRRRFITHVAVLCESTEVQQSLPQFIIGNELTFLKREFEALQSAAGARIILIRCDVFQFMASRPRCIGVRQKTAWCNAPLFARIVRALNDALKPYLHLYQPILLMDALPSHMSPSVLRALSATAMRPIIVPAKLTWALQPLDTHVFHSLKTLIREKYDEALGERCDSELSMVSFVHAVRSAIDIVFGGRCWAHAFNQNGYGHKQALLSKLALDELDMQAPATVGIDAPTLADVRLCCSARMQHAAADLWRTFVEQKCKRPPVCRRKAPKLADPTFIFGRTRSQTRALRCNPLVCM